MTDAALVDSRYDVTLGMSGGNDPPPWRDPGLPHGADGASPSQELASVSAVSEYANATVSVVQRSWVRVGGAFGLVGALAASVTAWRTRVLPSWMAAVGAAVVVLTLLHTWIPLLAALSSLVWIGVVSLLMMSGAIAIDRPSIGPAARRGTQA